jgi:Fe-S cluster assembly protein SufD
MATAKRRIEADPAFAELWGRHRDTLPGRARPIVDWRERGFTSFREGGFPTVKVEQWKYTNVAKWANLAFALPPRRTPGATELVPWLAGGPTARRLIFANGHLLPELSHVGGLPEGMVVRGLARMLEAEPERAAAVLGELDDGGGLGALNTAFTNSGAWIELPDGCAPEVPLQLLLVTLGQPGAVMTNPRNVIRLGKGARLRLIESHVALGEGHGLANLVSQITLGDGAELVHDRLQLGRDGTSLIGRTEGRLAGGARLVTTTASLGGSLVRNETELRLQGEKGEALLNGLYMPSGSEHIDTQIRIHHVAPGCHSNQFYKGVVDGRSHAVFAGKIIVHPRAQKTDAYQSDSNLLLSDDAEIDTKPELEIYADDVKCSHGATVGDLDRQALFYLRSRGLPLATARSLLTYGWAGEVIARFADPTVAALARGAVRRRLPGGEALEEAA